MLKLDNFFSSEKLKERFITYLLLFLFSMLFISAVTFNFLEHFNYFSYFILSLLSMVLLSYSFFLLLSRKAGSFNFCMSIFLVLGFWFKFSMQKIFKFSYREAIGSFVVGSFHEADVLMIANIGIIAAIIAMFLGHVLVFNRMKKIDEFRWKNYSSKLSWTIIFIFVAAMAFLNLKYNILLSIVKPDITLPFKGNVLFYFILTRVMIFAFLLSLKKELGWKAIVFGSCLSAIISLGVLSRMGVFLFFVFVIMDFFQNKEFKQFKTEFLHLLCILFFFAFFSYFSVLISSNARSYYEKKYSNSIEAIQNTEVDKQRSLKELGLQKNLKKFVELAVGRWIGVEGVMSIYSFPVKGVQILKDAMFENGYNGDSFYNKIANSQIVSKENSKIIGTSVPGPIGFFYYSGNVLVVFFGILVLWFLFYVLEIGVFKYFPTDSLISMLFGVFIAFDFFQFGLAPFSFFKYLSLTIFILFMIYFYLKFNRAEEDKV